jgi:hypothetical protein
MKIIWLMILTIAFCLFTNKMSAQDESDITLVGEKFSSYMNLTEAQKAKTDTIISEIRSILKAEREKFDEMRKKRESGEQLNSEDMMKMREQRESNIKVIKSDIEKIKAELTTEQLEKFNNVKLPNLEMRRRGKS